MQIRATQIDSGLASSCGSPARQSGKHSVILANPGDQRLGGEGDGEVVWVWEGNIGGKVGGLEGTSEAIKRRVWKVGDGWVGRAKADSRPANLVLISPVLISVIEFRD